MGKYKNDSEDETARGIGCGICAVILIIMVELFNFDFNLYWFLILISISVFIVPSIVVYLNRKDKAKKDNKGYMSNYDEKKYKEFNNILDQIDNMSGQEFEDYLINNILPLDGYYNISGTNYSGDYGVDIVAEKNGIKCAIQCKRFREKINLKAVQEIVAGRKHYRCDKAIVITNNYYSKSAIELAYDNAVELLDRDYIILILKRNKKM